MRFLTFPGRLPWAIVFQALRAVILTLWLIVLPEVNDIATSDCLGQAMFASEKGEQARGIMVDSGSIGFAR